MVCHYAGKYMARTKKKELNEMFNLRPYNMTRFPAKYNHYSLWAQFLSDLLCNRGIFSGEMCIMGHDSVVMFKHNLSHTIRSIHHVKILRVPYVFVPVCFTVNRNDPIDTSLAGKSGYMFTYGVNRSSVIIPPHIYPGEGLLAAYRISTICHRTHK